jgi:hypothetical protein
MSEGLVRTIGADIDIGASEVGAAIFNDGFDPEI